MSAVSTVRQRARTVARPLIRASAPRGPKSYSAVLRVRNEEEFLEQAVRSLIGIVDEIVIIDNASTDQTAAIAVELARRESIVTTFSYPHRIARQGAEHRELAATRSGRRSPRLLSNFYNWSIAQARHPYVVKFDGDMVALPHMADALGSFRHAPEQILVNIGVNVHPDGSHLDGRQPNVDLEPRVFPRRFGRYVAGSGSNERLASPYLGADMVIRDDVAAFAHLAFLKRAPGENYSPEVRAQFASDRPAGPPLEPEVISTLQRFGVTRAASADRVQPATPTDDSDR